MTALHPGLFYYDDEDKLEETIEYIPKQIQDLGFHSGNETAKQYSYFKLSYQHTYCKAA